MSSKKAGKYLDCHQVEVLIVGNSIELNGGDFPATSVTLFQLFLKFFRKTHWGSLMCEPRWKRIDWWSEIFHLAMDAMVQLKDVPCSSGVRNIPLDQLEVDHFKTNQHEPCQTVWYPGDDKVNIPARRRPLSSCFLPRHHMSATKENPTIWWWIKRWRI